MSFELIPINVFSLFDLAVFTTTTPLAAAFYLIYWRVDSRLANLIVANLFLCSAIYAFAVFMVDNANMPMTALVWTRIQYGAISLMIVCLTHLVFEYTVARGPKALRFISILYVIALAMAMLTYSSEFFYARSYAACTRSWLCVAPWMPETGPLQILFVLFWLPICVFNIFKLRENQSKLSEEAVGALPYTKGLTMGVSIMVITGLLAGMTAFMNIISIDLTLIGIMAICLPAAAALGEQVIQRDRLRGALSRYLSPEVTKEAMKGEIHLGGEIYDVTILFADIRSFTATAEVMMPEQVVSFLNQYFTAMAKPIFHHGGMLNKLYGDGLLAVFGAPNKLDNHALAAVKAAWEMQNILYRMNSERHQDGLLPIRVGIGLHSGHVVIGNIGTPDHMDYTPIGDTVNVASRVEQHTKKGGHLILMTGVTYEMVEPYVLVEKAGEATIREGERSISVLSITDLC